MCVKLEVLIAGGSIRVPPHVFAPYCTVALLSDDERKVLIEPGGFPSWEALERALNERNIRPDQITDLLISHMHMDHIFCSMFFKNATVHVHENYLKRNYESFGEMAGPLYTMVIKSWKTVNLLKDKDILFGCVEVHHTPHHSSDHVSFVIQTENMGKVFMPGDICYSRVEYFEYTKGYKKDATAELIKRLSRDCDWVIFTHDSPMRIGGMNG